jgi:hypothetical protein
MAIRALASRWQPPFSPSGGYVYMTDAELDQVAQLKTNGKIDELARQLTQQRSSFIAQQAANGTLGGATVKQFISFAIQQKKAEMAADFESRNDVYRQAGRLGPSRIREFGRTVVESRLHYQVVEQTVSAILASGHMKFAQNMRSTIEEMVANEINRIRSDFQRQVEIEARELEIAETTPPATPTASTIIYSLNGDNSRFNINSADSSTNIIQQAPQELFQAIRETIQAKLGSHADRDTLLTRIEALEKAVSEKTFAQRYAEFMSLAADHITVFAPFMPALAQLLVGKM